MVPVKSLGQAPQIWELAGLSWAGVRADPEGADYAAHTLLLGGRPAVFRAAKTTPTKAGQFVTLWQRSSAGPIRPFDTSDGVALFVIEAGAGAGLGQFVFPLDVLARHGVVSLDGKGGKRAMRVYTPDVVTTSTQARRTQKWQCEHFLPRGASAARVRELYAA